MKDLIYWKERAGQISWKLAREISICKQMKKDLKECDDNIKLLLQALQEVNPQTAGE